MSLAGYRPLLAMTLGLSLFVPADEAGAAEGEKQAFQVAGLYTETCSCHAPCACELIGLEKGCEGVGALAFSDGEYGGRNISGVRIAYALAPEQWVRIYVDAPTPEKNAAASEFAGKALAGFGKVESVAPAHVAIDGRAGRYTITVTTDEGKTEIMKFETEPVLGGDGRTPVIHNNTLSKLSYMFMQGLGVSCVYKDGERSFEIEKGRNAYFNDQMHARGEI